jgi:predicted SAM-dependent methyltransferase
MDAVTPLRLNIGAGEYPLPGFVSLDSDPACHPDVVWTVPPLPFQAGEVAEVYMGHLFEHLRPDAGRALLAECYRVLVPGGRLGVVVPDTRVIMARWLGGAATTVPGPHNRRQYAIADLDDVCELLLFSTCQATPHLWAYDAGTLRRALEGAGFVVTGEIDRYDDPRLSNQGAWYQCGWQCEKPAA